MRRLAALAIGAAAGFAMSGCSPGVDYPSIFPAVHDMPPPRADTTMDADQVQRATEALITERNRLSSEAQGTGQGKTVNPAAAAPADAAKKAPATAADKSLPAAAQTISGSANPQGTAAAGTQTAGAETKP